MDYEKVCEAMLEYQYLNNVKADCTTNVTIMYDYLRACGNKNIKIKSVIVTGLNDNNEVVINRGHLVIELEDKRLLDCSYDVCRLKESYYFADVKTLFKGLPNIPNKVKKFIIEDAIFFQDLAEKMNNGKFHISNIGTYHKQLDYIEQKCNKKFIKAKYIKS